MINSCPFVKEGSLVRHKVFHTRKSSIYRYGIVLSQTVRGDQTHVFWNYCKEFPVSRNGANYSSYVHTQYLDVVSEMP